MFRDKTCCQLKTLKYSVAQDPIKLNKDLI